LSVAFGYLSQKVARKRSNAFSASSRVSAQKDLQLGHDGLMNGSLGMGTDQIGHLIAKGWIQEWNCRIVAHGGILLV